MENTNRKKEPDCTNCIRYAMCEDAREGFFCAVWQSAEPEKKAEEDPNEAWRRGDDAPF